MQTINAGSYKNLVLATIAFAIAFAAWGLISGLAPLLKDKLHLSPVQTSVMIAIPVLLGSVARLPVGLLTDRFGGRLVFSILLGIVIIPLAAMALSQSYVNLLFWGFWLGLAGSSFAVGVAFVSKWFPPEKQGMALGVYGAGNIGQSIAVFFAPRLAKEIGVSWTFVIFGLFAIGWGVIFAIWARNAKANSKPRTFSQNLDVLRTRPLSWVLGLFYFLTFGGFVAIGIYLPTLLKDVFSLTPEDAGARAAGFVLLATACRPLGGWLSDRIGGQRVLVMVFAGIALLGWMMALSNMVIFSVGALGAAALLGLGNGAVFKLVPLYFPAETGTVTGLVGALGGLGGFFPPIVLGIVKSQTNDYTLGFVFLCTFSLACLLVLWRVFVLRSAVATAK